MSPTAPRLSFFLDTVNRGLCPTISLVISKYRLDILQRWFNFNPGRLTVNKANESGGREQRSAQSTTFSIRIDKDAWTPRLSWNRSTRSRASACYTRKRQIRPFFCKGEIRRAGSPFPTCQQPSGTWHAAPPARNQIRLDLCWPISTNGGARRATHGTERGYIVVLPRGVPVCQGGFPLWPDRWVGAFPNVA